MERLSALTAQLAGQPPGADFTKLCWLLGRTGGDLMQAHQEAGSRFRGSANVVESLRSAMDFGTIQDATWANKLTSYRAIVSEFVTLTNNLSVVGKLGARRVPSLVQVPVELTAASASWVGEGLAAPISELSFATKAVDDHKILALSVFSSELMKSWGPGTQSALIATLSASVARYMDLALLDFNLAAVAEENPQSLTRGITAYASTGSSVAALTADIKALLKRFVANGSDLSAVSLVVSPATAILLSTANTSGVFAFPSDGQQRRIDLRSPYVRPCRRVELGQPDGISDYWRRWQPRATRRFRTGHR